MVSVPARDGAADVLAQAGMTRKLRERCLAADELAAAGGVEPGEHSNRLAVLAGNDGVLQRRGRRGKHSDAQHADGDPGAGGELEILRQTPIEDNSLGWVARIGEAHGVARLVEAVLVERRARELGPFPIPGRYVRPAHAHFELVGGRDELELD